MSDDSDQAIYCDHCVPNPLWLDAAADGTAQTSALIWHPKVQWALDKIEDHRQRLDSIVLQYPWAREGDASADSASLKARFREHGSTLDRVIRQCKQAFTRLADFLQSTDALPKYRRRAFHTFTAAAALRVITILQRFEGMLFAADGVCVIRLYPDLPNLGRMTGPMVGLPYHHPVNELAYGHEAQLGLLRARIHRDGGDSDSYEMIHLPRFDAEHWQDQPIGTLPTHLHLGWVVPLWLLFREGPPPEPDRWTISVLRDEDGVERDTSYQRSPWQLARRPLPTEYKWNAAEMDRIKITPDLHCWVVRLTEPVEPASDKAFAAVRPPQVFISYSHRDDRWLNELLAALGPAQLQQKITVFSDGDIESGNDWKGRLDSELSGADVAVLLVTPAFLASKFVQMHEIPTLFRRHEIEDVDLIPVLAEPIDAGATDWTKERQLRKFGTPARSLLELSSVELKVEMAKLAAEIRSRCERRSGMKK